MSVEYKHKIMGYGKHNGPMMESDGGLGDICTSILCRSVAGHILCWRMEAEIEGMKRKGKDQRATKEKIQS